MSELDYLTKKEGKWGKIYELRICNKKLLKVFLNRLYPYMIGKKKEVKLMLKILENDKDKEESEKIYNELRLIKSKKNRKIKM